MRPHLLEITTFETTFILDFFIWDHIHLRPHSFVTTFIWDHIHLRRQSFETTFIWDHIHLRPHSFETTLIWDHIHLRPHSFETTFETTVIWDYNSLRSHSFYAMLKWSCFNLLCITFYDLPFTVLRETWSSPRRLFIWNFARLRTSVTRGDALWFVNASALRAGSRGEEG